MIEVRDLVGSMDATMEDMEKYLGLAMDNIEYSILSDEYYKIYLHHKSDYNDLHKVSINFIDNVAKEQKTDKRIIDTMMNIWSFEHENLEQRMNRIIEKEQRYKSML